MLNEDFRQRVGLYFDAPGLVEFLDLDIWHLMDFLWDDILYDKYDEILEEMGVDPEHR